MKNINDYLEKYQNADFDTLPFNALDACILTQIVHLPLEKAFYRHKRPTLRQVNAALKSVKATKYYEFMLKNRLISLEIAAKSRRFQGISLKFFTNIINKSLDKQFCAVCFCFADFNCIAFRGTDLTLAGAKESSNLCFKFPIGSQLHAKKYLESIARDDEKPIILCGHSKGGNLSAFSYVFADSKWEKRIQRCYVFDAPGLLPDHLPPYRADKIVNIAPYKSYVGILFHQIGNQRFVKGKAFGVLQHNPYCWVVKDKHFLFCRESLKSKILKRSFADWLNSQSEKDRERFITNLYEILTASGQDDFGKIYHNPRKSARRMLRASKSIPESEKKHIKKMIGSLITDIWESIFYFVKKIISKKTTKTAEILK